MIAPCRVHGIRSDRYVALASGPVCTHRSRGLRAEGDTVAKTTNAPAAKPLKQLEQLLPKITHDELLKLTLGAQVELGRRAQAYADAVYEMDAPIDLINEALAFCVRADELMPILKENPVVQRAGWNVREAKRDITNALNGLDRDDDPEDDDDA